MKRIRVPISLQHAVQENLRDQLIKAEKWFQCSFAYPIIDYTQRGTIAGKAYLNKWLINLNPILLIENNALFIEQVIPHELAHLLVFNQFGHVAAHGKEWRWMMESVLGSPASRVHQFNVKSVQNETFSYQCDCQTHQLTLRRHLRVDRKQTSYLCSLCKGVLKRGDDDEK